MQLQPNRQQRTAAVAGARSQGLERLPEWQILQRVRLQAHLPHPFQQRRPGEVALQPHAQRQGTYETADHLMQTRIRPARQRTAHHEVGLPAYLPQQHIQRRQQHHVQGDLARGRHGLERAAQVGVQEQGLASALPAWNGAARPVAGQPHRCRRARQQLGPLAPSGFKFTGLQTSMLPICIVTVAQRQRRGVELPAMQGGFIKAKQVLHQGLGGLSVGHRMVHHQHQPVRRFGGHFGGRFDGRFDGRFGGCLCCRQQQPARQRPVLQIQRSLHDARHGGRQACSLQINALDGHGGGGQHLLPQLATTPPQHGAQRVVAGHDGVHRALQRRQVRLRTQAHDL